MKIGDYVKIKDSTDMSDWHVEFVEWYKNLNPKRMLVKNIIDSDVEIYTQGYCIQTAYLSKCEVELVSPSNSIDWFESIRSAVGR